MRPVFRIIYRTYRLFSAVRYKTGRRFTRAGMMMLVAIAAAASTGVDTENTVSYQAFIPLVFVMLVAVAFSWFFRASFSVRRMMPRFGTVGEPLRYTAFVTNLTRKRQEGLSLLENLADPRPAFQDWYAVQMADERRLHSFRVGRRRRVPPFKAAAIKEAPVPMMLPGQEVEVPLEMVPSRRGLVRVEGATIARPDPFGLYRGYAQVQSPQTALILPRRYALPPIALPGTLKYQEGGVTFAANVGQSDEFVSLRDYRRGDPLRRIHWRSWAKAARPIVKEYQDEYFVRHALVLDTFVADPRSEAFEEAVSIAASFACTIQTQESLLDLLFVGPEAFCLTAGRGLAHSDQMLEILAAVRTCEKSFRELEHLVLDHIAAVSGCICVLLDWDEDRRAFVNKIRSLGVRALVLVVIEPEQRESLKAELTRDVPERFHVLEVGTIQESLLKLGS